MSTNNNPSYFLIFLLALVLSLGIGTYLATFYGVSFLFQFQEISFSLSPSAIYTLKIVLAGAFGGLLYSLKNGEINLPYITNSSKNSEIQVITPSNLKTSDTEKEPKRHNECISKVFYLGVIADCLIGVGGALVIFLILPGGDKDKDFSLTQLLGTAIIGGYGGRRLLDQALNGISQRQDKIEKQININEEKLKAVEAQAQKDGETLRLLSRHLDQSLSLPFELEKKLIENIQYVSPLARTSIFREAQSVLYHNIKRELNPTIKQQLISNTLKIFEALRDSDQDQDGKAKNNDRYPAHAAYAHMNLEKWEQAISRLEEAKNKLKKSGYIAEENKKDEIVYESHLVICKTKISSDEKLNLKEIEQLEEKLKKLGPGYKLSEIENWVLMDSSEIKSWLLKFDKNINPTNLEALNN